MPLRPLGATQSLLPTVWKRIMRTDHLAIVGTSVCLSPLTTELAIPQGKTSTCWSLAETRLLAFRCECSPLICWHITCEALDFEGAFYLGYMEDRSRLQLAR